MAYKGIYSVFSIGKKLLWYAAPLSLRYNRVNTTLATLRLSPIRSSNQRFSSQFPHRKLGFVIGISILTWLGFNKEDENKESKLIMTLKRAVLCTKKEQYDKAEQMLHLALRLAQQQQNQQGVVYCYDLMANLALETFQLEKAEKLFVSVLKLLLGGGLQQNDLKVIHISLKLARIAQLKADLKKAALGYQWCLEQINMQRNDNLDARMLYGVIQDWYAQFLIDVGETSKALIHLKEAYDACKETTGNNSEQSMLLLNDLGTTSFRAGDLKNAVVYLQEALLVGKNVENKSHLGVIHANLGLIMLEQGITKEAEQYCKKAWKLGKKHDNNESMEQANYCLDQIKLVLGK